VGGVNAGRNDPAAASVAFATRREKEIFMFAVLFEVHPKSEQWDAYLGLAKMLKPELEKIDGFIDNIRYKSLTRDGWLLSLSDWRDEKALVRWRTLAAHHQAQEKRRGEIMSDYHLRVSQINEDSQLPEGQVLKEQRLDETQTGEGTTVTLINARRSAEFGETSNPAECAEYLGLDPYAGGMLSWDVFEAVLTPGDLIVMLTWRDEAAARVFKDIALMPDGERFRRVRVVRDYGMFDRREAPQYYPDAKGGTTVHA
jgi:heme-degrading monooxygenase HmoA